MRMKYLLLAVFFLSNCFTVFSQTIGLSPEEQDWLSRKKDSLWLLPECYYPPYIYVENDTAKGASIDLLRIIEERLGVTFRYKDCENLKEMLEQLRQPSYQVVTSVKETEDRAKFMQFTTPYYDIPIILVTKQNNREIFYYNKLHEYRVAIYQETSLYYYFKELFPEYDIQNNDSDYSCLQSVVNGEADVAAIDIASFSHLCLKHQIRNLRVANIIPFNYNLAMATHKSQDTLVSILNKAILSISSEERSEILNKWVVIDIGEESWIKRYFVHLLVVFGSIVFIIALIIFWNRTLRRNVRIKTRELEEINHILKKKENDLTESNEKLKTAKEKAEESDRLKTAFLNNMSHEIRTPLNGIVGFSDMITSQGIDVDERKQYGAVIKKSSNQLLNIVNDILDIARIEAGQLSLTECEVNLHEFCKDLVRLHQYEAEKKGLTLNTNCAFGVEEWVLIDGQKLNQVLNNLIGNAIKFTDEGSIDLYSEITGDMISFTVSDTGKGIDEKMQQKIFERFSQVEFSNHKNYGGTGLGLSISKGFVEKMGGSINVSSEPGKGSVFSFTVPYKPSLEREKARVERDKRKLLGRLQGLNVLVAEDEEINYLYISQLLSGFKINTIQVVNGIEAVNYVKGNSTVDLILMDIKMPLMDGHEATAKIKKLKPEIPIIAVTAHAFSEDRENALNAGCDDYLSKPVTPEQLTKTIEKLLKFRINSIN